MSKGEFETQFAEERRLRIAAEGRAEAAETRAKALEERLRVAGGLTEKLCSDLATAQKMVQEITQKVTVALKPEELAGDGGQA